MCHSVECVLEQKLHHKEEITGHIQRPHVTRAKSLLTEMARHCDWKEKSNLLIHTVGHYLSLIWFLLLYTLWHHNGNIFKLKKFYYKKGTILLFPGTFEIIGTARILRKRKVETLKKKKTEKKDQWRLITKIRYLKKSGVYGPQARSSHSKHDKSLTLI